MYAGRVVASVAKKALVGAIICNAVQVVFTVIAAAVTCVHVAFIIRLTLMASG